MSAAERLVIPAFFMRESMPGDTWLMLPDVRQADIDELAALGVTPEHAIRYGLQHSSVTWTAFFDGHAGAMFGVVDRDGFGVPWAVFTTVIDRMPVTFLRASRRYLDQLARPLVNYVDARNTKTVQWLSWLGFAIDDPEPFGIHGEPFHRFWRGF